MIRNGNQKARDEGFTVIELVVVIGILSVLIGLLLPAVQSARESARRTWCMKNLGQLSMATLSFEATHGGFPPSISAGRPFSPYNDKILGTFSTHCLLLPYLEQNSLYNCINFELQTGSIDILTQNHYTAASQTVGAFICPSDSRIRVDKVASNSYRGCIGLGQASFIKEGVYQVVTDGVFVPAYTVQNGNFVSSVLSLSNITDGLSNTLAFSEKPIGASSFYETSSFCDWYPLSLTGETLTADQWTTSCSTLTAASLEIGAGSTWMMPGVIYTSFSAAVAPNSLISDCGSPRILTGLGLYTARSYHPYGVNASMADGSVRNFSSTTNINFWRSLATKAGGESMSQ